MKLDQEWYNSRRFGGLARFGIAITLFTIAGHVFLGFEQAFWLPLVALARGYKVDLPIELLDAWAHQRRPRFLDGLGSLVGLLLPAHISSLAIAMLLYSGDRLAPMIFAIVVALTSKALFRVKMEGKWRHFFNPSNFGITLTLVLFPWVGVAPPYQFTTVFTGAYNWLLPVLIIGTGSILNMKFTHRIPLIIAWLGGFLVFGMVRVTVEGMPVGIPFMPITGVAFIVYTLYMITDPATTPPSRMGQVIFGLSNALVYHLLTYFNIVYGIFFALTLVCFIRGMLGFIEGHIAQSKGKGLPEAPVSAA